MTEHHISKLVQVGAVQVGGGGPLALIAGPCVIESREMTLAMAQAVKQVSEEFGLPAIFKASFDKANRMSRTSFRGPGLKEGLTILAAVKEETGLPIDTDIHDPEQARPVSEVADLLQIPAFLCRQTDLVMAAAATGKPVLIKKGQFLAPEDMAAIVEKAAAVGEGGILVAERGASFGYHDLVVDMRSLAVMQNLGWPVVFDATHSVQRPGGAGTASSGDRQFLAPLARAAAAVGIDALFVEVHPDPDSARSDAKTQLPVADLPELLKQVLAVAAARRAIMEGSPE